MEHILLILSVFQPKRLEVDMREDLFGQIPARGTAMEHETVQACVLPEHFQRQGVAAAALGRAEEGLHLVEQRLEGGEQSPLMGVQQPGQELDEPLGILGEKVGEQVLFIDEIEVEATPGDARGTDDPIDPDRAPGRTPPWRR